jgi:hypothetical protein
MAIAALEQVLDWSPARIEAELAEVTAAIERGARALGLAPLPARERGGHMIGIELPAGGTGPLLEALAERGVHVGVRSSWLRISPHLHTTQVDLERLFSALEAGLEPS